MNSANLIRRLLALVWACTAQLWVHAAPVSPSEAAVIRRHFAAKGTGGTSRESERASRVAHL
jgi:hypothetical protein